MHVHILLYVYPCRVMIIYSFHLKLIFILQHIVHRVIFFYFMFMLLETQSVYSVKTFQIQYDFELYWFHALLFYNNTFISEYFYNMIILNLSNYKYSKHYLCILYSHLIYYNNFFVCMRLYWQYTTLNLHVQKVVTLK